MKILDRKKINKCSLAFKKMRKNSFIKLFFGFGAVGFIQKITDYILILVAAQFLLPAEYGRLTLYLTIVILITTFLATNVY